MAQRVGTASHAPPSERRILQNHSIIWIDSHIGDTNSIRCQHTLEQLSTLVNDVPAFQDVAACLRFLDGVFDEQLFIISSSSFAQDLVPMIHPMHNVYGIFIFSTGKAQHELRIKEYDKVKGVYTEIDPLRKAIRQSIKQCNQDSISVSLLGSSINDAECFNLAPCGQLGWSYLYTKFFKEILAEMKHDEQGLKDLSNYYRQVTANFPSQAELIDQFERDYSPDKAVWWYTKEDFAYQIVNRSLRLLEADILVNISFFVDDLHQQIKELHRKQLGQYRGQKLTLYRGQVFRTFDIHNFKRTIGGLLSFNSLLSASKVRDISLRLAERASSSKDTVGVLFVMTIDPAMISTPFADISQIDQFNGDAEMLFSLQSVFRVDDLIGLDEHGKLFEVQLTLAADDDPQLGLVNKRLNEEFKDFKGWQRIGQLITKYGRSSIVEDMYITLLAKTLNDDDRAQFLDQLGSFYVQRRDYNDALLQFQKASSIKQKMTSPNHRGVGASFNNIASVYGKMRKHSEALSSYQEALIILQANLPEDDPDLATCHKSIGSVCFDMAKYPEALSSFTAALNIMKKTLRVNHADLAVCHDNIAMVYSGMQKYTEAMMSYREALDIRQNTVPINYRELSMSHSYIGSLYSAMGMQPEALSSIATALEMQQKYLPAIHPYLAYTHFIIGALYAAMGMRAEALPPASTGFEMQKKALLQNSPTETSYHSCLRDLYREMKNRVKACPFGKTVFQMLPKHLLRYHRYFKYSNDIIFFLGLTMGISPGAWPSITTALETPQTSFEEDNREWKLFSSHMGRYCPETGITLGALRSVTQSLEMRKNALLPDQADLANLGKKSEEVYSNVGIPSETTVDFNETSNQEDADHLRTPLSHISATDFVKDADLPMNLEEDHVVPFPEAQPIETPASAFTFDSSEQMRLIFLQMAPIPSSTLYKNIGLLSGSSSTTRCNIEAYADEPTPSTLIIDTEGMPSKQLETLLDYIAGHKHLRLVYVRGEQPKGVEERRTFFTRYRMIRGMDNNEEQLIVQWAMDTANEYRQMGDALVELGDKDKARPCFVKSVTLHKQLSEFQTKNIGVK